MSRIVNIDGKDYDFSRCTREQLEDYAAKLCYDNEGDSSCSEGIKVFAAALVSTSEKKTDVAREIAELVCILWDIQSIGFPNPINVCTSDELRKLSDRYNKAV